MGIESAQKQSDLRQFMAIYRSHIKVRDKVGAPTVTSDGSADRVYKTKLQRNSKIWVHPSAVKGAVGYSKCRI